MPLSVDITMRNGRKAAFPPFHSIQFGVQTKQIRIAQTLNTRRVFGQRQQQSIEFQIPYYKVVWSLISSRQYTRQFNCGLYFPMHKEELYR